MRANTSLFGHILGSNEEIEGYYEMHIGYYSWKSLLRQKLIYFSDHSPHKKTKYLFDKILHNEHYIDLSIFQKSDKFIISIREPISSIGSTIKLYKTENPSHEFATLEGATKYYENRLKELVRQSEKLKGNFYFLDADSLRKKPEEVLPKLSNWLNLNNVLKPEYRTFVNTGVAGTGDSSERMSQGKISHFDSNDYQETVVPNRIMELYIDCVKKISMHSENLK